MKNRILLPLLFLVSSSAFAANDQIFPINKFGGINTRENSLVLTNQTPDSQNVLTDNGQGIEPRDGFISFSNEPSRGLWSFGQSNGNRYMITLSSNTLKATTGSTFNITIATVSSSVPTVAASLGDVFCFVNKVDGLKEWDGNSIVFSSPTFLADKIATFKGRLVIGDVTGNARTLYLSKYVDPTTFVAPVNPSDDDAAQIIVSGFLDEAIAGLYGTFQDKLIIFKPSSFQGLYGNRRSNFALRTFSDFVGISDDASVQDCDGKLRWLSKGRLVYEFDGSTFYRITNDVEGLFSNIAQGDSSSKSVIETTQSDFQAGSISPPGNLSTSFVKDSVVLSTSSIVVSSDDIQSDFLSGTFNNTSALQIPGSLELKLNPDTGGQPFTSGSDQCTTSCTGPYYQAVMYFNSTPTVASAFYMRAIKSNFPGDYTFNLRIANSDGTLGTILQSTTVFASKVSNVASTIQVNLASMTALSAGTSYWLQLVPNGTCNDSPGNYVRMISFGFVGVSTIPWGCGVNNNVAGEIYRAVLDVTTFTKTGSFLSRTFNTGISTNTQIWSWGALNPTINLSSGATVTYQTQTSYDGVNFNALSTVAANGIIQSVPGQYIRYQSSFTTIDQSTSPVLNSLSLTLSTAGVFTSQILSIGTAITSWGAIVIGDIQNSGIISYQFGSTSTANVALISNWQNVSNGSIPSISIAPYAAFRVIFSSITNGNNLSLNLSFNDLTVNWNEGSTLKTASGYINQRYWLSTSISSSANNTILVYDKNQQWQKFQGINADVMAIHNSKLYFGNSSGIYQTESGNSDNGTAITAYYRTPNFAPTSVQNWSSYKKLYLTTDNSDSVLSTSFQMNGIPTDYPMATSAMNVTTGVQDLKLPFSVAEAQQSKIVNFLWSVTGTSFWRLLNGNLYFTPGQEPD